MNKRIKKFMRLGVATAFAVALGMVPALGTANARVPGTNEIERDSKGSLVIHKYVKEGFGSNDATGNEITDPDKLNQLGEGIDGVKFELQKVKLDNPIWTQAGQNQAVGYTPATAAVNIDPSFPKQTLTTATVDGKKGVASASELELGLYLVTELSNPPVKTPEGKTLVPAAPFLVMLPMTNPETRSDWNYDVHVYPKNQTTGAVKTVNDEDVQSSDAVDFDIAVDVPPIPAEKKLANLVIKDTLDKEKLTALEAKKPVEKGVISVVVKQGEEEKATLTAEDDYKVKYTSETQSYEISLTETGLDKVTTTTNRASGFKVVATIRAIVNQLAEGSDGIVKNKATVVTNSGSGDVTTETGETVTKYGKLKVFKYADGPEAKKTPLEGAEFQLYYCGEDGKTAGIPLTVGEVNKWTTGKDGTITINGLHVTDLVNSKAVTEQNQKKYCLLEVTAPDNYELLAAPVPITFTSTELGTQGAEKALKKIEVKNNPSTTPWLPLTGGPGIILLVIAGVAIIAGGTIYGLRSRKLNK